MKSQNITYLHKDRYVLRQVTSLNGFYLSRFKTPFLNLPVLYIPWPCSSSDHMDKCLEPCLKLLDCGHACHVLCYQDCSEAKCEVIVDESGSESSCGHPRTRKCGADQGM